MEFWLRNNVLLLRNVFLILMFLHAHIWVFLYVYVPGRLLCNGYLLSTILYCVYVLIALEFSHTSMSLPGTIIPQVYFKYLAYYSYIT